MTIASVVEVAILTQHQVVALVNARIWACATRGWACSKGKGSFLWGEPLFEKDATTGLNSEPRNKAVPITDSCAATRSASRTAQKSETAQLAPAHAPGLERESQMPM